MDIEQLKLILDVVSQAGEGAFWVALFWLGKGYFVPLVWLTLFIILIRFGRYVVLDGNKRLKLAKEAKRALDTVQNEMNANFDDSFSWNLEADLGRLVKIIRDAGDKND